MRTRSRVSRAEARLELLGPVLEDQQQAAVGQRLGDDAQVAAARQQPILLLGGEAAGEPAAMLLLPVRIVADLGQVAGLAHRVEQAVELGPVGEEIGLEREQAGEGLVGEDQAAVAGELGDSGGQAVEHVALGVDEAGELGAGLLAVLDVDRIAGDPRLAERHLDHPHHPPLAADRGRDGAGLRLALLAHRGGLGWPPPRRRRPARSRPRPPAAASSASTAST